MNKCAIQNWIKEEFFGIVNHLDGKGRQEGELDPQLTVSAI